MYFTGRIPFSYDAANQLTTSVLGLTRTTFTYDANGNLQVEQVGGTYTTHTWDEENRLTQVQKTGMTTNQYTFNGDGQRVRIVDSQGTKKPIWDLQNILLETNGANATQVVYTLEPTTYGNLISQRTSGVTSSFLADRLGSARSMTSNAGAITDTFVYKAYGDTYSSTGGGNTSFRWIGAAGYYFDKDLSRYFVRMRHYSTQQGRFLSADPLGLLASPVGGPNMYEYASAAPTVYVDPSGALSIAGSYPVSPIDPRVLPPIGLTLPEIIRLIGAGILSIPWWIKLAGQAALIAWLIWRFGYCYAEYLRCRRFIDTSNKQYDLWVWEGKVLCQNLCAETGRDYDFSEGIARRCHVEFNEGRCFLPFVMCAVSGSFAMPATILEGPGCNAAACYCKPKPKIACNEGIDNSIS